LEEGLGGYAKGQKDYGDMLNKIRTGEIDIAKLSAADRNHILERALGATRVEEDAKTRRQTAQIAADARAQSAGAAKRDLTSTLLQKQYQLNLKAAEDKLGLDKITPAMQQEILQSSMDQVNSILEVQGKPGLNKPTGAPVAGVRPTTEGEYNKLPKGAHYVDPDGKTRIKG
jgi:hypothetical protein